MRHRTPVSATFIEKRIYILRGQKVMLDRDSAELYGVPTKRLNERVKRNARRFPADFMFRLTKSEMENWRSQFATSNFAVKMGIRRPPYAFTERGVAMLSSVLDGERAILVNVEIMRPFVRLRRLLASEEGLARKLDDLERKYDAQFKIVFDAIRELMEPPGEEPRAAIGFRP